jgi:hypothetical protein
VPPPVRVLLGVSAAMSIALSIAPALAQEHQHPGTLPRPQAPPITSTAKKLNESYQTNCEHFAAGFDSPGRELFDRRIDVVNSIGLKSGMVAADIGAGNGLFSRLMAERVGPSGIVYPVEISPSNQLHQQVGQGRESPEHQDGPRNRSHTETRPEFRRRGVHRRVVSPFSSTRRRCPADSEALKPDGVLLLVDLERIDGVSPDYVVGMVRAGKGTFTDEIRNAGSELVEDIQILELDYVLKFKHREALQERPPESPR